MAAQSLRKIAQALDGAGIGYMVIGGQAVLLYGDPRLTEDIDITLAATPDEVDTLLALAVREGWRALPEHPRDFAQEMYVLPAVSAEGVRVDFIFSFTPFEREAIARARTHQIEGAPVRFAAPEDLIAMKMFAGRPRDLEDARNILLRNPGMELDYLRQRLAELEQGMERSLLQEFERLLPEGA